WTPSAGINGAAGRVRVAADRVNADKLYAVGNGNVFRSEDGGESFTAAPHTGLRGARLRPVFGLEGEVWLVSRQGVERSSDSAETFTALPDIEDALALGFGRAAEGQTYPALYVSGVVGGVPGIHRSDDAGQTWT